METILVWTLVIAAIAIVLMLALLIASEREAKRVRAELRRLRAASQSEDAAIDARPDSLSAKDRQLTAKVSALTEQLQSKQAVMARMQGEVEALRAENNWLRLETEPHQAQRSDPEAQVFESAPKPRINDPIAGAADHRFGERRHKTRPIYAAAVVVLLLAGAVIYFMDRGRSRTFESASLTTPPVEQSVDGKPEAEPTKVAVAAREKLTETTEPHRAVAPAKAAAFNGTNYEVVRSTRVFSQPNDGSRPLARIEAGMEVNVVGVRDDWLEVRSRHGRPSGFIKSDTAVIKELK